ncbi:magnesium transporter NIPA-domain-containing protein [Schizophyllum amplum]|uniref:Magnesium transporter NIPA-domain-containing protein n=1 Tax=Schizophyllum amplum TaxID=97359 RepID=A0A550C6M5_9AGAR|nr:magnesium transporter NIPA-domain-containing protein [Auriculariopsis ampla]
MIDDKYIGLTLAVSGSIAIGTSFIITKKGLNDAGERDMHGSSASENLSYLRNVIWWAGMLTIANFAAYTFAPPIMVTPIGCLSVLIGAILASFLLNEKLGHLGRLACTLCLVGTLIIIMNAPEDTPVDSVEDILKYAVQPGFMLYCFTVLVYTLVMIYLVAPRYGAKTPSISIMAIKGFGIAVKLTLGGSNQFVYPSTYVFGAVVGGCIMIQMNYFNKALDTFNTNVVNPMYFVGFTTSTLVASLILFQGFNTASPGSTLSLLCGFIITFLGVHLLNYSRDLPNELPLDDAPHAEGGVWAPRLSLQGRMSVDGWDLEAPGSAGGMRRQSRPGSHGRANSFNRQTLFDAYDSRSGGGRENVGLSDLREESESEDENADEHTHLRSASDVRRVSSPHAGSTHSHSPRISPSR